MWDWLKSTSRGQIRTSVSPNKLMQDGLKQPLLCHECEELFSKWEKPFAGNVFRPLHLGETPQFGIHYEGVWALRFATSISWRVLEWSRGQSALGHLTDIQRGLVDSALPTWAAFLLGSKDSVLPHEQHALLLDVIENHNMDEELSPFLNRYIARTFEANVVRAENEVLTFAKMGRFLVIGFVSPPLHREAWQGTRVRMKRGTFGGTNITVPYALAKFMNERASKTASFLNTLSPRQRARDRALIDSWGDKLAETDSFRAILYDVKHSGAAALAVEDNNLPTEDTKK